MQNPLLVWTFLKNYPDADPSSFHSNMEYRELANYLKIRQPEKMTTAQSQKGELLGVNSCCMSPFDTTERVHECIYCGKAFKPERSTAKYCRASHRVLMLRRRRKAVLVREMQNLTSPAWPETCLMISSRQHPIKKQLSEVLSNLWVLTSFLISMHYGIT
jgi:hypothetical protein